MEGYRIIRKLGTGSYGCAHLALHIPSDTKCVIKEIRISHMSSKELEEARREVEVLSSLSHPYITQFQDSFENDGRLLIAMDYCGGGDLHTIISNRNGVLFPEDRVLDWFVQLCLAIKYIHDRRILHRDIKSQNVFLTDDGKVRLGDFGIAKIMNSTSDLAKTCIGTPYYLSPEMCENKPYNNKSDIWALGCVLYEMITLKHAFEANNMKGLILKIIKGSYQPIPARYSRDLRLLMSQIFQREPRDRPSISVILRKNFVLKRVPRFISGCEEEELMSSLLKRKCNLPASARRIVVVKRPPDVTDPASKYGGSVSLNKRGALKTPVKGVARLSPQCAGGPKRSSGISSGKIDKGKKLNRKKCPSENSLLASVKKKKAGSDGQDANKKRSKSVPRVLKQACLKSPHQGSKKKKQPSPVKLQLMLNSAGFKKSAELVDKHADKENAKVPEEESGLSAKAQALLVEEYMAKKLEAASKDLPISSAKKAIITYADNLQPIDSATIEKAENILINYEQSKDWIGRETPDLDHSVRSECMSIVQALKTCIDQSGENASDKDLREKSQKDVKELTNITLKKQKENCSDDEEDEDGSTVSSEELRQIMQEKMKKLVQLRAIKLNQMVQERRKWAYLQEKFESSIVNDSTVVLKGGTFEKKLDVDQLSPIDPTCGAASKSFCDDSIDDQHENILKEFNLSSSLDKTLVPEIQNRLATSGASLNEDDGAVLIESLLRTVRERTIKEQSVLPSVQMGSESNQQVAIVKLEDVNINVDETSKQTTKDLDINTPKSSTPISSKTKTVSFGKRARWGTVHSAGLENSPLETTASEMDSTTSSDIVEVFPKVAERKQWAKGCKDIVSILAEAQIVESTPKSQKIEKDVACREMQGNEVLVKCIWPSGDKPALTEEDALSMGSTYTVDLKNIVENSVKTVPVGNPSSGDKIPLAKKDLNSTFTIGKKSIEKANIKKETNVLPQKENESQCKLDKSGCKSAEVSSLGQTIIKKTSLPDSDKKQMSNIDKELSSKDSESLDKTFEIDSNSLKGIELPHNETFTISDSTGNGSAKKARGGILGMLRSHISPLARKKPPISYSGKNACACLGNDTSGDINMKISNSGVDSSRNDVASAPGKKSGKIKSGIVGILRKLSSRADDLTNTTVKVNTAAQVTDQTQKSNVPNDSAEMSSTNSIDKNKQPIVQTMALNGNSNKSSHSNQPKQENQQSQQKSGDSMSKSTQQKSGESMTKTMQSIQTINTEKSPQLVKLGRESLDSPQSTPPNKKKSEQFSDGSKLDTKTKQLQSSPSSEEREWKNDLRNKSECRSPVMGNAITDRTLDEMTLSGRKSPIPFPQEKRMMELEKSIDKVTIANVRNLVDIDNELDKILERSKAMEVEEKKEKDNSEMVQVRTKECVPNINASTKASQDFGYSSTNSSGTGATVKIVQNRLSGSTASRESMKPLASTISELDILEAEFTSTKTVMKSERTKSPIQRSSKCLTSTSIDSLPANNFSDISNDSGLDTQETNISNQSVLGTDACTKSLSNYTGNLSKSSTLRNRSGDSSSWCGDLTFTPSASVTPTGSLLRRSKKLGRGSSAAQEFCNEIDEVSLNRAQDVAQSFIGEVLEKAKAQVGNDVPVTPTTPTTPNKLLLFDSRKELYKSESPNLFAHTKMAESWEVCERPYPLSKNTLVSEHSSASEKESLCGRESKTQESMHPSKKSPVVVSRTLIQEVESDVNQFPNSFANDPEIQMPPICLPTVKPARPSSLLNIGAARNTEKNMIGARPKSLYTFRVDDSLQVISEKPNRKLVPESTESPQNTLTRKQKYQLGQYSSKLLSQLLCEEDSGEIKKGIIRERSMSCVGPRVVETVVSEDPLGEEEKEDLACLRKSMEMILSSSEQTKEPSRSSTASPYAASEVWHLDSDGAVISGEGGVYGWIEEQREKLESLLGLDLFIKAYHHLDAAQEKAQCVEEDSIREVEEMVGPDRCYLVNQVLQLVIAESVYHN